MPKCIGTSAWVFSCKFTAYFSEHLFLRTPLRDCFCMYKRHFLFLIIFADFSSTLVSQIPYLLFLYSGNLCCTVKKETILLFAWRTLYIVRSRDSVS